MTHMKSSIFVVLAAYIFIAVGTAPAFAQRSGGGDDRLQAKYSQNDLMRILKAEVYGSVEKRDNNAVMFKVDGKIYGMFIFEDNDLQMYYGTSGIKVKLDTMNKWNKDFRHSRAYIDDGRRPDPGGGPAGGRGPQRGHGEKFRVRVYQLGAPLPQGSPTRIVRQRHRAARQGRPRRPSTLSGMRTSAMFRHGPCTHIPSVARNRAP